jgi:hypothetical protein
MGQMREGIETQNHNKSSRQRIYKTAHFRNRWAEQKRCGESRTRRDTSILSAAFRKTCYRFEYIACPSGHFGSSRFSPIHSPVNIASPIHLKHTHPDGLRPIRYKHPLPLRHFALCRSRSAHKKSSCLGRHDVTARQKRGHRRIPIPQRKSGVRRSPYRCSQ